jgi:hypothetical protein
MPNLSLIETKGITVQYLCIGTVPDVRNLKVGKVDRAGKVGKEGGLRE